MMNASDITYSTPGGVFNLRVGAIILREDKALLVNNGRYYYSVGGRVQLHETLEQAVVRETFEETGESFEADRLVWIGEEFFTLKGDADDGKRFHEIAFIFLMKPNLEAMIVDGSDIHEGTKEWLEWVPIDRLNECKVYPEEFKTELRRLPETPAHVVRIE